MKKLLMLVMVCCAAAMTSAAPVLYDDFESYELGAAADVTGGKWVPNPAPGNIIFENWNKVFQVSGSGDVYSSLGSFSIPDSDTQTTVFFRVYGTGTEDSLIGVADQGDTTPDSYGDMDAYVQFNGGNLTARNGGSSTTLISAVPDGWYNIWLVVNNSANTYDVYINQGTADATTSDKKATGFVFRSTSTTPIVSFAQVYGSGLKFDDVYITPGLDLTNPAGPCVPPTPDAIEGFYFTSGSGAEYNTVVNGGLTLPGTASVGTIGVPGWDSNQTVWDSDSGTRDNDNSDGDGWHFSEQITDGPVWNTSETQMVEGKSYTFFADVQGRWDCDGITLSIIAGDDPNDDPNNPSTPGDPNIALASASYEIGGNGVWYNDLYVSYTATAADAGKCIGIKFEGTSTVNVSNSWIRIDNVHLFDGLAVSKHGPTDFDPAYAEADVTVGTVTLSWTPSNEPNVVSQTLYYFVDNLLNFVDVCSYNASGTSAALSAGAASCNITVDYDQYVLWRIDTNIDMGHAEPNTLYGETVYFTTQPSDFAPVVDAGSSYVTWLGNLPQTLAGTIDDLGEGDVVNADVTWAITSALPWTPSNTAMQMYDRTGDVDLATLAGLGYDSALFEDWIGTDARGDLATSSEPLVLTLSGVPAGTYTWTSYHHDPGDQTGPFSVTVIDAAGTATTTGIDVTNGAQEPNEPLVLTITSNGGDIKLLFDNTGLDNSTQFFVMNGFVLSDGVNPNLAIDFGTPTNGVGAGYQAYTAQHEVAATFTAQAFSALGTTVTVLPQWGRIAAGETLYAAVTKTSTDPLNPTATFDTNVAGDYTITLTATDTNGSLGAQSGSDTLTVRVAAEACAAAILSGVSYNPMDFNEDCIVDIAELADFAAQWLDDISLTGSVTY